MSINQLFRTIILGIIVTLILGSCQRNPVTGKKQLSLMSPKKELAIGKEANPQILAQFGVYNDDKLQAFITKKGNKMASISHMPKLNFHFKVVDSDVVNAFAVPGGYVYFTRGIMAYFNNEAQFAGVLGHEIGHITHRHSAQSQTKQILTQVGFMGGMILSPAFRGMAQQASQGMQLLLLKYSRTHESQSDVLGVEYSSKIGYDAHQMAGFFETLARLSTGPDGKRIPEFMSTHPDPGKRHSTVNQLADKWQSSNSTEGLKINRNSYLRMIDGIIYGPDPRQGYEEQNIFYHPELKFQFPIPTGWTLQNTPNAVQIGPKDGSALITFTVSKDADFQTVTNEFVTKYKFQVTSQQNITVNGLSAYKVISKLPQKDPKTGEEKSLTVQTVLIKYNNSMYIFHGLCNPDQFSAKRTDFGNTMLNFRALTNAKKINVKPERIKIVETTNTAKTLQQAFVSQRVPASRYKELAILNGMKLTDMLPKGTLFKIVKKL